MKKIIIAYICCMFICFLIPNLFIKNNKISTKRKINEIKLLLTESNEVIELSLDDYIKGVLIGEMPATYDIEALKAQAVVARTYTLYKLNTASNAHENADMCDDINHCQAYKTKQYAFDAWDDKDENEKWEKIEKAVNETKGQIITYKGNIINAFFHSNSGGKTEDSCYIWGQEKIPYLKSVSGNESNLFEDTKVISKEEFKRLLKEKYNNYNEDVDNIKILDHTISDRVYHIRIGNLTLLGTELRKILELRSSNFEIKSENENLIFKTIGYGHGVGMSQEGANNMALNGSNYKEIICHYYTDVEITEYNN